MAEEETYFLVDVYDDERGRVYRDVLMTEDEIERDCRDMYIRAIPDTLLEDELLDMLIWGRYR